MGEIQCSRSGIVPGDSARSAPVSPSNARSLPLPAPRYDVVPRPHTTTSAAGLPPAAAALALAMGEPAPPCTAHQPAFSVGGEPGSTRIVDRSAAAEQNDPGAVIAT